MFVLCRTCGEETSGNQCTHNDDERSLDGTWVSEELKLSFQLGYQLVAVHEVWHFDEQSCDLFVGYVKIFLKEKLQSKGFPSSAVTEEDKRQYIQDIRKLEGIELEYDKISANPGRVVVAKLCLNTLWVCRKLGNVV